MSPISVGTIRSQDRQVEIFCTLLYFSDKVSRARGCCSVHVKCVLVMFPDVVIFRRLINSARGWLVSRWIIQPHRQAVSSRRLISALAVWSLMTPWVPPADLFHGSHLSLQLLCSSSNWRRRRRRRCCCCCRCRCSKFRYSSSALCCATPDIPPRTLLDIPPNTCQYRGHPPLPLLTVNVFVRIMIGG